MQPNAADIKIHKDGIFSTRAQELHTPQATQVRIAIFINPSGLRSTGYKQFVETDASGSPILGYPGSDGMGTIAQGYLEGPNVDVIEEIAKLHMLQRWQRGLDRALLSFADVCPQGNP